MKIEIQIAALVYLLELAAEGKERKDVESMLVVAREHDDSALKLDIVQLAAELLGVDLG